MYEIVFEITNKCNRNCLHCSSRANEGELQELSLDLMNSMVKKYKPKWVNISGGEPQCRNDLPMIIKSIKQFAECKIKLYTSLFYEFYDTIDEICIPCFGLDKDNDIITKTNYKPFALIRQYMKAGIIPTVHMVPNSLNINYLQDAITELLNLGITKIKILKLVEQGRCLENKWLVPSDDKLKDLYETFKNDERVNFGHPFDNKCSKSIDKLVVMCNGKIIPCETYKDGICKCEKLLLK